MKLSFPAISMRSCLLALASVLILPMPASYADTFTLSADLTGRLRCLLLVLREPDRPR